MRSILVSAAVLVFVCSIAVADDTEGPAICNAALAKDLTTTISTREQDLDFLKLVDLRTFTEAHDKGSFGASLPISDVILKMSADWDNFRQNRSSYFEKIGYKSHSAASDYQHFEITSPVAYTEWGKCIQNLAGRSKEGLFVWKVKDDENTVLATIYYKVPELAQQKYKAVPLVGKLRYGKSDQQIELFPKNKKITTEQEVPLSIPRKLIDGSAAAIEATIEAGKFSATIVSDWRPKPLEPIRTTRAVPKTFPCHKYWVPGYPFWKTEYGKSLVVTQCTVPDGVITEVVHAGCVGGAACGHFWPVFDHNWYSPDKKTVNVVYATDHGDAKDNPLLLVDVYYIVNVTTCTGTDGVANGAGCYKAPAEALAETKTQ
jgi:hypothetical protein